MRSVTNPRHSSGRSRYRTGTRWSPAFVNVVGLTLLVFLMGGSSRADVWSLPILRPVAVLSMFYGLWSLSRQDIAQHRFLFAMAGAIVALVVASLLPLPPFVWTALAGRETIVAIDDAAGLSGTWRPVSMAPELTWNALFALSVPLAILVNGVGLSVREHRTVMVAVLVGGGMTMMLAMVQLAGGGDAALYPYLHSSFGEPSGLFSNRNHEALFLAALLPLLGFLLVTRNPASRAGSVTRFLAIGGLLVTVAFILILGSRAGLAAGLIGIVAFVGIATTTSRPGGWRSMSRTQLMISALGAIAIAAIIGWAMTAGSARSIQRVLASDDREELRYVIWPIIADALPRFMPAGTGAGTYERVFRLLEPDAILRPTYSNHAHNDWLEVVLTCGVPGILLMASAALGFVVATVRTWSLQYVPGRAVGWMGLVIIFMAAIGSIIDYPLRTPILSVLFTLACVWVALGLRQGANGGETMPDGQEVVEGRVRT